MGNEGSRVPGLGECSVFWDVWVFQVHTPSPSLLTHPGTGTKDLFPIGLVTL